MAVNVVINLFHWYQQLLHTTYIVMRASTVGLLAIAENF